MNERTNVTRQMDAHSGIATAITPTQPSGESTRALREARERRARIRWPLWLAAKRVELDGETLAAPFHFLLHNKNTRVILSRTQSNGSTR